VEVVSYNVEFLHGYGAGQWSPLLHYVTFLNSGLTCNHQYNPIQDEHAPPQPALRFDSIFKKGQFWAACLAFDNQISNEIRSSITLRVHLVRGHIGDWYHQWLCLMWLRSAGARVISSYFLSSLLNPVHTADTDKTRPSCLLLLAVWTELATSRRVSKFSVADSLDLSPILFTPLTRTRQHKAVLCCPCWRCELGDDLSVLGLY